eukprot:scaffold141968_cov42-Tisochrysis_lutea.AAC.2
MRPSVLLKAPSITGLFSIGGGQRTEVECQKFWTRGRGDDVNQQNRQEHRIPDCECDRSCH